MLFHIRALGEKRGGTACGVEPSLELVMDAETQAGRGGIGQTRGEGGLVPCTRVMVSSDMTLGTA